jgi:hypothetical protein
VLAVAPPLRAAENGLDFFETKIRPVLVERCYRCHSSATKQRGGLALDSREAILKGGDRGPALRPGRPADSLLVQVLHYNREPGMPPKGKLPDAVIADVEKWVALGAPDPRTTSAAGWMKAPDVRQGRTFWAFQPPRRPIVPKTRDARWPRGDIDAFVLVRLEANSLRPAPDADRSVLLRRLYLALIGLPPTPEQIGTFVDDDAPDAYARVVEQLLASPHFGERWGRHWLDVARFAESSGGGRSLLFPDAWRYRDYVLEAFNSDKPYDRFVTEQIAGDLLPANTPQQRREQLIATAFLALGPTNYEQQNKDVLVMDVIDEQLDSLGRAFLGLTLGCARCHDHKFDPIPTRDYYALAGILSSTQTIFHGKDHVSHWLEQPLPGLPTAGGRPALAMSVRDAERIEDCALCIGGNVAKRGAKVPRGFLQVSSTGTPAPLPAQQSGRRELAAWLASSDNPLTARVFVNRVWHHLFGAGLVRTVDNFGAAGERPSHADLLDALALRFMRDGWSVKNLIRRIVLSHTFQMSSAVRADLAAVDPENRLLGAMNRRRLDAECLRDAMLSVSGRLDLRIGGPTFNMETAQKGANHEIDYRFDGLRRSVYTPIFRNKLLELFEAFDFGDPNLVNGGRNVSTVATQALYLMNSPFVREQARQAAEALLAVPHLNDAGRVHRGFRLALGRPPTPRERDIALRFLASSPGEPADVWARFYQALFACLDFRSVK